MKAERWALVERICRAALDRPPAERAAYLAEACAGDESLRREVASLLAFETKAQSFIEASLGDLAAEMMARQPVQPPTLELPEAPETNATVIASISTEPTHSRQ